MFRARRRPLLRGAMMAGAGAAVYHAGKQHEAREQEEPDQEQQVDDTSQAPADEAPPEAAASTGTVDELERLKGLRDEGALTQAEFDAAKQKVLGTA